MQRKISASLEYGLNSIEYAVRVLLKAISVSAANIAGLCLYNLKDKRNDIINVITDEI